MRREIFYVEFAKENPVVSPKTEKAAGVYDVVSTLISAFFFVGLILTFIFRVANVDGSSMNPTLQDRDNLIISNFSENYEHGDIIVINREHEVPLIKRVIGTSGDIININFQTGEVSRNGEILVEDYIAEPTHRSFPDGPAFPLTVPEGYVFVMGDNRNNSLDSRSGEVGLINTQSIVGKMLIDFNNREAK